MGGGQVEGVMRETGSGLKIQSKTEVEIPRQ
jgi:hypothetical protein